MATKNESQISELKINYLTEAQYNEALNNNEINDDEIYMTPEVNEDYAPLNHTHDEYMNSTDPVGTGSFSLNRKSETTTGKYSVALGYNPTASAQAAISMGYNTTASATFAVAEGYGATAEGSYSHAEGAFSTARTGQHVQGHYNTAQSAGSSSGTTGTAFIIGNGTSSTKSNAFRVTYGGAAYGLSAYNATGADMAEFREWFDGNPDNEDRRGYFVTMDGMNIKIAEPGDYICGVISANPCLVGNGDEDWQGRFLLDEFGSYIYEEREEIDRATGETFINKFYKVNPNYDPTRPYIQRENRPEWDYVGLCGVINTRDDGSCKVNGFCKCGDGGVATKANRGYRVLERVNDNVIKILFFLTGEVF